MKKTTELHVFIFIFGPNSSSLLKMIKISSLNQPLHPFTKEKLEIFEGFSYVKICHINVFFFFQNWYQQKVLFYAYDRQA